MIIQAIKDERKILKQLADQAKAKGLTVLGGDYWRLLDYILAHGQEFKGRELPRRYRQRELKHCYFNAWSLVRSSKALRYVEGKCASAVHFLPFDHAWAIDTNDRVVDPTLQDLDDNGRSTAGEYEYFGVVFTRDQLPRHYDETASTLQRQVHRS